MLKRECGGENNGKLQHLFIPGETETLVPEFTVEDLPLARIAALVPEFAVKDLPLGRTLIMMLYMLKRWLKNKANKLLSPRFNGNTDKIPKYYARGISDLK